MFAERPVKAPGQTLFITMQTDENRKLIGVTYPQDN